MESVGWSPASRQDSISRRLELRSSSSRWARSLYQAARGRARARERRRDQRRSMGVTSLAPTSGHCGLVSETRDSDRGVLPARPRRKIPRTNLTAAGEAASKNPGPDIDPMEFAKGIVFFLWCVGLLCSFEWILTNEIFFFNLIGIRAPPQIGDQLENRGKRQRLWLWPDTRRDEADGDGGLFSLLVGSNHKSRLRIYIYICSKLGVTHDVVLINPSPLRLHAIDYFEHLLSPCSPCSFIPFHTPSCSFMLFHAPSCSFTSPCSLSAHSLLALCSLSARALLALCLTIIWQIFMQVEPIFSTNLTQKKSHKITSDAHSCW